MRIRLWRMREMKNNKAGFGFRLGFVRVDEMVR